jgi:PhzF family phenazine biosynthesis protein
MQVDAFANKAFEGNPAAVCFLSSSLPELPDEVLQKIAAEKNLSETAFLRPLPHPEHNSENEFKCCDRFNLRWFTPKIEVPLCGHATLASAAALFDCAGNTAKTLFFDTLSGELAVERVAEKGNGTADSLKLAMNLPLLKPVPAESVSEDFTKSSHLIAAALGESDSYVSYLRFPNQPARKGRSAVILPIEEIVYDPTLRYLVIVFDKSITQNYIEDLTPDIKEMYEDHDDGELVGVILTGAAAATTNSTLQHDFYSRFFGPWAGIDEDPVTGSAHSVLGPYWAEKLGKTKLKARQCSQRGGELDLTVDWEAKRVVVAGGAVVVIRGELLLDV